MKRYNNKYGYNNKSDVNHYSINKFAVLIIGILIGILVITVFNRYKKNAIPVDEKQALRRRENEVQQHLKTLRAGREEFEQSFIRAQEQRKQFSDEITRIGEERLKAFNEFKVFGLSKEREKLRDEELLELKKQYQDILGDEK